VTFLVENFRDSTSDPQSSTLNNFEEKLQELNDESNVSGLLDYLLSLKDEIVKLPISHKNTPITIQRIVLLILPLLKLQDDKFVKDKEQ
jgi:hypothetical protein